MPSFRRGCEYATWLLVNTCSPNTKVNFTSPGLSQWTCGLQNNVKVRYRAILAPPSPCLQYSGNRSLRPASLATSTLPHLPNPKLHRPAASSETLHNLSNLQDRQPTFLAALVLHNLKFNLLCFPVLEAIRSQPFSARHNHNSRRAPPAVGSSALVQRYMCSLSRRLACLEALRAMQLQRNLLALPFSPHNHNHRNKTTSRDKQPRGSSNSK